jgi:predicted ester cyclase
MQLINAIDAFYNKALTVNKAGNPSELLSPFLTADFVSKGSIESKGKEQLLGQIGFFWNLIPDLKWEIQEVIQQDETYVVRSRATGTPNGNFFGLPTNGTKSFDIMTIDIHKVKDGIILSTYHLEDWATAMKQLKG